MNQTAQIEIVAANVYEAARQELVRLGALSNADSDAILKMVFGEWQRIINSERTPAIQADGIVASRRRQPEVPAALAVQLIVVGTILLHRIFDTTPNDSAVLVCEQIGDNLSTKGKRYAPRDEARFDNFITGAELMQFESPTVCLLSYACKHVATLGLAWERKVIDSSVVRETICDIATYMILLSAMWECGRAMHERAEALRRQANALLA